MYKNLQQSRGHELSRLQHNVNFKRFLLQENIIYELGSHLSRSQWANSDSYKGKLLAQGESLSLVTCQN